MSEITLNLLDENSRGRIKQIQGKGKLRKRFFEMGLVPGSEVEVIKRAPLGDPIELKIKGYNIAFRKNEAQYVLVEPI
ncbi:FeoA family protein [Methanohalobium evestigatum Z-7303]|uniref:FeoA family protein n=1 Tax=Methanohalobium evestigatum (strain ATCC BAA-1072 / DSM 3721 / NBRC 107634 / OCM 161 / Z-7303) TaxID=644295 RepID=D7E7U6_METEZ|nr:ferrous iron transport protein A [Methanohalobium evestigatum]ADI74169.1 FeoA family protein [Methanohalobium evestigatum Z-7303]